MEVILVQLTDEGGEIGMLEHSGENGLCELVHVLDDEAVAEGAPGDDGREGRVFEHPTRGGRGVLVWVGERRDDLRRTREDVRPSTNRNDERNTRYPTRWVEGSRDNEEEKETPIHRPNLMDLVL